MSTEKEDKAIENLESASRKSAWQRRNENVRAQPHDEQKYLRSTRSIGKMWSMTNLEKLQPSLSKYLFDAEVAIQRNNDALEIDSPYRGVPATKLPDRPSKLNQ